MFRIIGRLLYRIEAKKFQKAVDAMAEKDPKEWPRILKKRNYGLDAETMRDIWIKADRFAEFMNASDENYQFYKYVAAFAMILLKKMLKY